MYFCPRCHAEVSAEANFCVKCGYNQTNARLTALQTPTSEQAPNIPTVPSMPTAPIPTHTVKPTNKHNLANAERMFQTAQPIQHSSEEHPSLAKRHPSPIPGRPTHPTGLIRPVGMQPQQEAVAPDIHSRSTQHIPTPSKATPPHLLALIPETPPDISKQRPQAPVTTPGWPQQTAQTQPFSSATPSPEPKQLPAPAQFNRQQEPPTLKQATAVYGAPNASNPSPVWPGQPRSVPHEELRQSVPPGIEVVKGRPQIAETFEDLDEYDESFVATSKAAEHWRTSWRNRQRSEAGPATSVSRGQSSVSEPLLAMQHSLARIRAIIAPQGKQQAEHGSGFWIAVLLMICLMAGLLAYIISTYLPETASARLTTASVSTNISSPSLSLYGPQFAAILQGQMLHLQGKNFNAGAPIIFTLDGNTTINGTDGREMSILTSAQGSFAVSLPTATWSPGDHLIQAMDNKSGQSAYFNIQVNLAHPTANTDLALSGPNPLLFKAVNGKGNPAYQYVLLTNTNPTTAITWIAKATTNDNISWLDIDPATTSGTIKIGGAETLKVGINGKGLKSKATPYIGEIVFTINQTEQLTLPVELQVQNQTAELVIDPNPLVGLLVTKDHTCQANGQLQIVNISNAPVSWNISMNTVTKQHIQFTEQGKVFLSGTLAPEGQPGDSQALTLVCTHVQGGDSYQFNVNANNFPWPETVLIQ